MDTCGSARLAEADRHMIHGDGEGG